MNYYNENDPKAAAWLRELIKAKLIPDGDVDERSIVDVKPHELTRYTQQHFFAGIGGWSLALKLAGWPEDKPVRTGSCPCQPFSITGKQLGTKDKRHLWPNFRDLISFGEPTITFGEQVASPLGREWLAGVRTDLEGLGYEVGGADLCAAGIAAPHIRQRLYWVAVANCDPVRQQCRGLFGSKEESQSSKKSDDNRFGNVGCIERPKISRLAHAGHDAGCTQQWDELQERDCGIGQSSQIGHGMGDSNGSGSQGWNERIFQCDYQWPVGTPNLVVLCTDGKYRRFEPSSFPLAHGVSGRVGLLRGYGNAIVPQVAAEFIQAAVEAIT